MMGPPAAVGYIGCHTVVVHEERAIHHTGEGGTRHHHIIEREEGAHALAITPELGAQHGALLKPVAAFQEKGQTLVHLPGV
jgi:hypothetical protein